MNAVTIYNQIPFLTRACLDMKNKRTFSDNDGKTLISVGAVIQAYDSHNKRGTITIDYDEGADLYNISFTDKKNNVEQFEGLDVEGMISLLDSRTVSPL